MELLLCQEVPAFYRNSGRSETRGVTPSEKRAPASAPSTICRDSLALGGRVAADVRSGDGHKLQGGSKTPRPETRGGGVLAESERRKTGPGQRL